MCRRQLLFGEECLIVIAEYVLSAWHSARLGEVKARSSMCRRQLKGAAFVVLVCALSSTECVLSAWRSTCLREVKGDALVFSCKLSQRLLSTECVLAAWRSTCLREVKRVLVFSC